MPRPRVPFPAFALALLLVAPLAAAGPALARQGTPAPGPPAGLIVPDPGDCAVAPRPLAFFEQLAATPPALPADADRRFARPGEAPRPWALPAGEPADPATVAAVAATTHELLACLNAGDYLRFSALLSDELARIFAAAAIAPEVIPFLATPTPLPPAGRLGYLGVREVRVLPDGRVAGLADTYDPTEPPFGLGTDFGVFVKVGDRWLFDALIEHVAVAGAGTPTA